MDVYAENCGIESLRKITSFLASGCDHLVYTFRPAAPDMNAPLSSEYEINMKRFENLSTT
jgi:hypothetical protein